MELSVLSWNVRGENEKTKDYLKHVLGWLKDNKNEGQEVDFILLQESSAKDNKNSLYRALLEPLGYNVFKFREQSCGRGDCYLFAAKSDWTVGENAGYIPVWDPAQYSGSTVIRSPYFIEVEKNGVQIRLINFHNAFGLPGIRYVCAEKLAEFLNQHPEALTILAGDFNLFLEEMPNYPLLRPLINNRYDHILTSPSMNYLCGEALDEDDEGRPELWEYSETDISSVNGSDHCAVFGRYVIE